MIHLQPTKIGVLGFNQQLIGKVDLFELNSNDPLIHSKKFLKLMNAEKPLSFEINLIANHFYYRLDGNASLSERVSILNELCESVHSSGCILKLVPSFFKNFNIKLHLEPFIKEWTHATNRPLWLDLPASLPFSLPIHSGLVVDPLWHSNKLLIQKDAYWKIHGWHDSRWVRRYSKKDLIQLVKLEHKLKPKVIVFGHSQRLDQVSEYLDAKARV